MFDLTFEVLFIFLLVIINGLFAMSETAVVSARKSRLQDWAHKGNARAKAALELANAPNPFLYTVQICITLVCTLAGAFGAASLAERVAVYVNAIPVLEPYSRAVALAVVVGGITYLLLMIGEFIPRRVALAHADRIATFVANPMRALLTVSYPLVRLLTLSTERVAGLWVRRSAPEPNVMEEEIKMLVQQGTEAGVLHESEQDMVEAVFRLGDKGARALMTRRSQIVWLDLKEPLQETKRKIIESGYSRFPVADASLDDVLGIIQAKDLLSAALAGNPMDLKASLQQPLFLPRTMPALHVVESFRESGKHMALVVDEYGGIEGLLTQHNILEAIAGEIAVGGDAPDSKAVEREDGSWLLDGMLPVDQFKEIFHLESLPGEKRDAYQTLGGFLFTQMGRVPSESDHFEWGQLRFEIVDMDGKRIDKVLVSPVNPGSHPGDDS